MLPFKEYFYHSFIWIKRFKYRRGWSLQSPFAYQFTKEVLFDTRRYEAYTSLKNIRKKYGERQWGRYDNLVYRLVRNSKPTNCFLFSKHVELLKHYVLAGNSTAKIVISATALNQESQIDFCYIAPEYATLELMNQILSKIHPKSMIVCKAIHQSQTMNNIWETIKQDKRVVVTFDLYYLGIIVFKKELSKENHTICF